MDFKVNYPIQTYSLIFQWQEQLKFRSEIKNLLRKQYHFSNRQADWALTLYERRQMEDGMPLAQRIKFNAFDDGLTWFDDGFRIKLTKILRQKRLFKPMIDFILLNICQYNPQEIKQTKTPLYEQPALWRFSRSEQLLWQAAFLTTKKKLLLHYVPLIHDYLQQQIGLLSAQNICAQLTQLQAESEKTA